MLDAPQTGFGASAPLNVTVLLPCDEPKFAPAIVTDVPVMPEFGESVLI